MSWPTVLGTVAALVAASYLLEGYIFSQRAAQEPPYIRPSVPLIGHFISYVKKGSLYFGDVGYGFASTIAAVSVGSIRMRSELTLPVQG
jgi:hypothetical protein